MHLLATLVPLFLLASDRIVSARGVGIAGTINNALQAASLQVRPLESTPTRLPWLTLSAVHRASSRTWILHAQERRDGTVPDLQRTFFVESLDSSSLISTPHSQMGTTSRPRLRVALLLPSRTTEVS